jgi:NADH:ubiquinone oxidoreductase subunit K
MPESAQPAIPLVYFLIVSAALFCLGVAIILVKRHVIMVLMGIELILNAANLNLVAFSQYDPNRLQGQLFALFVIVVAAAEAAVALAMVLQVYRHFNTTHLDEISRMRE